MVSALGGHSMHCAPHALPCALLVVHPRSCRKGPGLTVRAAPKDCMRHFEAWHIVVAVAKKYQTHGLTLQDLINEGNLGLIKAALRFDETRGFKFISYAVWWIRQGILQALAEQSRIVRLPLNKIGLTNRIGKAYHQLEQEFEREPTAEELAEILHIEKEDVLSVLNVNTKHVSLDTPFSEEDDNTLLDVFANPNADKTDRTLEHYESLKKDISSSLELLSLRQNEVLCYFFGIDQDTPLSLEDIGQKFNLTRERVRQIKDKALTRLKSSHRCNLLKVYLG